MPLPPAAPRKPIHTRIFDCRGYERDDGLWDIEGHLTDAKSYPWRRREGLRPLAVGEFVHDMWIRLTIDLDMKIHEAFAATDASPYQACGNITPNFVVLKGRTIKRGWTKELRTVIGSMHGCTHMWELLGRIAAVAYQSTNHARNQHRPLKPHQIPYQFNSCHMYTPDSPATRERWPHLYRGPLTASSESPEL